MTIDDLDLSPLSKMSPDAQLEHILNVRQRRRHTANAARATRVVRAPRAERIPRELLALSHTQRLRLASLLGLVAPKESN